MNASTLQLLISLIAAIVETVLPKLTSESTTQLVTTIIDTLEKILPDVVQAGEELATSVKNIIDSLKISDVTTEQWTQLDTFETQIDNEFDAAAKDEGV